MKKHVVLFTTLAIWGLAYAFPNVGRIAFRVVVVDEDSGFPLKNVPVTAVFTDHPVHWGDDSIERVKHLLTDTKGMCRVNPRSLDRNLEWDMKNNLCEKPLRMDYNEPIGVRYREP